MRKAETDAQLSFDAPEFVWSDSGLNEEHRYLLPLVKEWLLEANGKSVLDLGCGNGAATNALAEAGFSIVGMDSSSSGIKIAQSNYPNVQFRLGSLEEELPVDLRRRFNAVIAIEVVEHLFLPRNLLRRAKEALAPGGVFILTTPYHGYLKNLALAICGGFDAHWHPLRDYGHIKFFSRATLITLLREQQFRIGKIKSVGRVPWFAKSLVVESFLD